MKRLASLAAAAAAVAALGVGAHTVAGADDDPLPPSSGTDQLSEAAITADWCGYLTPEFHPGGLQPSVEGAVQAMIAGDATPADLEAGLELMETAPEPDAARAAGYLYGLEGEPAAVAADYALIRNAGRQAIYGEEIANADAVLDAARTVDGFLATECGTED